MVASPSPPPANAILKVLFSAPYSRLSERPCLDSYDREYWCPALVAWADRPQVNQPKAESYLDVKYSILF